MNEAAAPGLVAASEDETRQAQRLILAETMALNEARWDDWLALFTEDCTYWVPLTPGQPDPLDHVSLIYEDRDMMRMRINRQLGPRAFSHDTPPAAVRVIGPTVVAGRDPAAGEIVARTAFHMLEYFKTEQRAFGGTYTHRLRGAAGGLRIREKRVDLLNRGGYHKPIQLFF